MNSLAEPPIGAAEKAELLKVFLLALGRDKIRGYRPYGHPDTLWPNGAHAQRKWSNKPWQRDFHAAGKTYKERLALCGNGVGKSLACCMETAIHATGIYPDWWEGRRFDHPVEVWTGAINGELQRDSLQTHFIGDLGENYGTGCLPPDKLIGRPTTRQAGVTGVVDTILVKHTSGGASKITMKTYGQGWRSWQAGKPHIVQLDEEPDENSSEQRGIYAECQTRIFRSGGMIYGAVTPLLGETEFTRHFMYPNSDGIYYCTASWDDVSHLTEDDKRRLRQSYPHHQVEARTLGIPMMGEGRIYPTAEDKILIEPFEIPKHYARIMGLDFGIGEEHPTAAVWIAWDRDRDIAFLYDAYRRVEPTAVIHAAAMKRRGAWIPVAWPHDGLNQERQGGNRIKELYEDHGLNMLPFSARHKRDTGGPQPTEPIIDRQIERMETGGFRVFSTCHDWLSEYRSYHRKEGKIVRRRDDLMSATHYAMMMLQYAQPEHSHARRRQGAGPSPVLRMSR